MGSSVRKFRNSQSMDRQAAPLTVGSGSAAICMLGFSKVDGQELFVRLVEMKRERKRTWHIVTTVKWPPVIIGMA